MGMDALRAIRSSCTGTNYAPTGMDAATSAKTFPLLLASTSGSSSSACRPLGDIDVRELLHYYPPAIGLMRIVYSSSQSSRAQSRLLKQTLSLAAGNDVD